MIPFGRMMEPTHQKRAECGTVCEDKECIHTALIVIAIDSACKLVHADSHVKRAFAKRRSGIELTVIAKLSLVLSKLLWVELAPLLIGDGVE